MDVMDGSGRAFCENLGGLVVIALGFGCVNDIVPLKFFPKGVYDVGFYFGVVDARHSFRRPYALVRRSSPDRVL